MTPKAAAPQWKRWHCVLFFCFVLLLSYFTYFHRYWHPQAVFWDENYHIASAQKYLHRVYFMEQHPPLGKLLVAAGEKMFHPNEHTDQFLGTDYGTEFEGFSFVGYRFFSALLGWWIAPVFFLILLLLLKNPLQSALLSFLYVFDNAIIMHLRGAMLEGPLLFFAAVIVLLFLLLLRDRGKWLMILWSVLYGVAFALAVTTKVLGLIMILFTLPVLWTLWPRWGRMLAFVGIFMVGFLPVYAGVWQVHFALGQTVNTSLSDDGYYQASEPYKQALQNGIAGSLTTFPVMLRDSLRYVNHYNSGAPRLDLCKEDENGSPFYFWPLGARTINYRWETPDGTEYRYLYLVPNPVVWWTALFALFLGAGMVLCSVLTPLRTPLKHRFLLCVFIGVHLSFMIAVGRIDRVLYLYHYFIPLFLSFVILALVFDELRTVGKTMLTEHGKTMIALVLAAAVFLSHQFYRPFTYYEPLTDEQFARRNIFNLWELRCVNCEHESGLVIPSKMPEGQ